MPCEFRKPQFVERSSQSRDQVRYRWPFREQLSGSRCLQCFMQFQSVEVAEQIAGTNESIAERLLNLSKRVGRFSAIAKAFDPPLRPRATFLKGNAKGSIEISQR